MIISKTPYRISFFGGGSDYPTWLKKNTGEVISTTINKYIYISCRVLPNFFNHKYRISYSRVEEVQKISDIEHYAVKKILEKYKLRKIGMEIHYDGDLPSNSGMGSSSCFVVGLLNCLNTLENSLKSTDKFIDKKDLAKLAIKYEQKVLKEMGGCQDQIATSYGGFNNIQFLSNTNFIVKKINIKENTRIKLEENLFLVYTNIKRYAHAVASSFVSDLSLNNKNHILEILKHVKIAKALLKNNLLDDFGRLLDESWQVKKKLSKIISNDKLDEIYNCGLKSGALGGKLLGAGAGGFFVFYVPGNKHNKFKSLMKKKYECINFKFENSGSRIIHKF